MDTSTSKRARACDACHSIKIRCDLGSAGGQPPCGRCVRLEKECTITPTKRQKDRVAELEAQVEALTRQLASQGIQTSPSEESPPTVVSHVAAPSQANVTTASVNSTPDQRTAVQKKRRLEDDPTRSAPSNSATPLGQMFVLDVVVSKQVQSDLLNKYVRDMLPYFPIVGISETETYETLRKSRPILLQAIIYAASPGTLSIDEQEGIARVVMEAARSLAIEATRSIETIQALQIAVMFFRSPKLHMQVDPFQLAQLASNVPGETCDSVLKISSSSVGPVAGGKVDVTDIWRARVVGRFISAGLSGFMRKAVHQPWTALDEDCLWMLEYSAHSLPSDRLLCQYVRVARLNEQISTQLHYHDIATAYDVCDPAIQRTMQGLQNLLTDWKAQVPSSLRSPRMTFWEHSAALQMCEAILHTSTNKQAFTAPYLAERLSVTDFPAPVITLQHITSAEALRVHSHALIDLFTTFTVPELMALPSMFVGGRVAYAEYVLVRLYIASTAAGNTYGAFFNSESLMVEEYLQKVIIVAQILYEVDDSCGAARVISGVSRLKEWVLNYKSQLFGQSPDSVNELITPPSSVLDPAIPDLSATAGDWFLNWTDTPWDTGSSGLGFDLDKVFVDEPLSDWPPGGYFPDGGPQTQRIPE